MSQATYQLNRNNSQSSSRINYDQRYNNIDMNQYSSNNSGKEKDMLISQLKSKIFELELHEKDYDVLNERYKQLQIDFAALNDSKHLLECEKEKRDEEYNKLIGDLQCENENLQIGFNDKLTKNKNCFSQNSMLQKQLELKDNEIYDLTAKLNDLENQFCRNEDERANLQKLLNGLNDIKNSQNYKIEQLIEDNKTLKQICEEQDNDIKAGNEDRENLCKELEKKNNDIANGEGVRVTLFVSGCTHHCNGCFNPMTWDFDYGKEFTEETEKSIIDMLSPSYIKGLTLLGGEPMEPVNQRGLLPLLKKVKELYPSKTIWCYSGYLFDEELLKESRARCEVTDELLSYIDILVDGEFILEKKNIMLQFRGSENQRIIDVKKSLEQGEVVLYTPKSGKL